MVSTDTVPASSPVPASTATPGTVARDVAEVGLTGMVGTLAVLLPAAALIQVLADAHDYRQPAGAVAVWLAVLGAAAWLVPRQRRSDLSTGQTAAAIAIAIAVVAVMGLGRRADSVPGSVDLAIFGTIWLLALVVISRPARVWIPAALAVFAVHGGLLVHDQGLNPLSLSELEAAGYILVAVLIPFAALRPAIAVHASLAARRAALASRSAAESAAAAAIAQERQSRLALLEQDALPLLRAIADGTLDVTTADVRDQCARHAAVLRHSLTGRGPAAGQLMTRLEPVLRAARDRGLLVTVQVVGDPEPVRPPIARAATETVAGALRALAPQSVTLTVLGSGDDVELFLIDETGSEALEFRWRKDGDL